MIVADGTEEAYEAFVGLYAQPPFGPQAREWLDRHRRMVAWNNALIVNTAAAYRAFLAQYPDSDLTATARKLEERLRNRPNIAASLAAVVGGAPNGVSGGAAGRRFEPADQRLARRPDMPLRCAVLAAEESRSAAQEARRAGYAEARQLAAAAAFARNR